MADAGNEIRLEPLRWFRQFEIAHAAEHLVEHAIDFHSGDVLAEGRQVVIFPEGTRVAPGERAPYQPGVAALAKSLKLPVIPVAHNSGSYWLTPGPRKIPGTITLEYLPTLPAGLSRADLTEQLEGAIEGAMARLETRGPDGQEAGASIPTGEPSHGR